MLFFSLLVVTTLTVVLLLPILNYGAYFYETGSVDRVGADSIDVTENWRIESVNTEEGIQIPTLIRPPTKPTSPWIIFIPGNGEGQLLNGYEYLSQLEEHVDVENDMGFAVWGMRGFDGVSGRPSADNIQHDQFFIVQYLIEKYQVNPRKIHLIGFSFGTDLALLLALNLIQEVNAPASMVLISTQGLTIPKWIMRTKDWYSRWLLPDRYDLRPAFESIEVPTLIIESADDLYGDINFILRKLKIEPKYLELEAGGHGAGMRDELALKTTYQWIQQVFIAR